MRRIKRKDLLTAIRIAGYHGDKERGILLYVKNWVSLQAYGREFDAGAAMRQNGVPCECFECRRGRQRVQPEQILAGSVPIQTESSRQCTPQTGP